MRNVKFILIILLVVGMMCTSCSKKEKTEKMIDLSNYTMEDVNNYSLEHGLSLTIIEEYSDNIEEGKVISQSIVKDENIKKNDNLTVVFSLGKEIINYADYNVNELGNIPVMMYHGIVDMNNSDTKYTGGNVDKDGYNRTSEAFRQDLEFYYQNGYRMIRLNDYINGTIDVPLGKSPIVLTFDDGKENNIKVTGLDESGNIIIDKNSAVGILEEFKSKYPDFNVTATFFINASIFDQEEYNEKILSWLIDNGYDIGNHTMTHANLQTSSYDKVVKEVGYMYKKLEELIPGKYVKIVALPFGTPYSITHENRKAILSGTYDGFNYETYSTLRVAWEADYSPFSSSFDKTFIKRIRAYDNNGEDFDIEMNFKRLSKNRYISDGNKNKIVVPEKNKNDIEKTYNLEVITY